MSKTLMLLTVCVLPLTLVAPSSPPETFRAPAIKSNAGALALNPPLLVNISTLPKTVEVNLTAAITRLELQPGVVSEVFAYNGHVPGPTLDVREGDHVIVHFKNELGEPTTVHWHGIHLPFESDGSPFHPIKPGESKDYDFIVRRGTAGTYWYHPHPDHRTGFAIGKGLFGAIVVHAADDPLPALTEKLLILPIIGSSRTALSISRNQHPITAASTRRMAGKDRCSSSTVRSCRGSRSGAARCSAGASSTARRAASSASR